MAKTIDTSAQKKRQQKIILIVLGVLLLGVLVFQLPKLTGGGSSSTAAPAAGDATSADGTTVVSDGSSTAVASTTAAATTTTTRIPAGVPRAVLVGVTVGGSAQPKAGEGQLRAFTLFTEKDPFLQSLPKEPTAPPSSTPAAGSPGTKGGPGTVTVAPVLASATISTNGVSEALTVKQLFPEQDQLFKLVSLNAKSAKIAVSGGAFTDGQLITVPLGKNVTLVNTATGARYVVKLLYVGEQPEQIKGFTTKPAETKK